MVGLFVKGEWGPLEAILFAREDWDLVSYLHKGVYDFEELKYLGFLLFAVLPIEFHLIFVFFRLRA